MNHPSFAQKLRREFQEMGLTTLYFAAWITLLVTIKVLVLEEYHIKFHNFSVAVIGALLLAKVVLLLEHVPLGKWVDRYPAIADVVVRALLYGCGVLVLLLLEKAFEARHEYGGFGAALRNVFKHRDMPHVWADTLCIACALLGFNFLSVLRRRLGQHGLTRMFLLPPATARTEERMTDEKHEHPHT